MLALAVQSHDRSSRLQCAQQVKRESYLRQNRHRRQPNVISQVLCNTALAALLGLLYNSTVRTLPFSFMIATLCQYNYSSLVALTLNYRCCCPDETRLVENTHSNPTYTCFSSLTQTVAQVLPSQTCAHEVKKTIILLLRCVLMKPSRISSFLSS